MALPSFSWLLEAWDSAGAAASAGELVGKEPWHLNCKRENPRMRRGMTHVARAEHAGRLLPIFPRRK